MATFDYLANNADRKGGHCLVDGDGHLWGIDHGLCFHVQPKLRTVIWEFAGEDIDPGDIDDVDRLARQRSTRGGSRSSCTPRSAAPCSPGPGTFSRTRAFQSHGPTDPTRGPSSDSRGEHRVERDRLPRARDRAVRPAGGEPRSAWA